MTDLTEFQKDKVDRAMERWQKSRKLTDLCAQAIQSKGLQGEKAMEEFLTCRIDPEGFGVVE